MTSVGTIVEFLQSPASYPNRPEPVQLITTEGSWIALAGDYAYKVKRPVLFDHWDFTTRELREKACLREVRLNRRLGGDIYLDVIPIFFDGERYSFHGNTEPAEHAIRMRRLPSDRMMDRVLAAGSPDDNQIDALADLLAEFYSSARSATKSSKAGTRDLLDPAVRQNFKILREYLKDPNRLDPIESALLLFMAQNEEVLERRVAMGKVRDGHGSLRTDHICLLEPPIVIGCVEIRDRERNVDILADFASLWVDLDLAGRPEIAQRLWNLLAERIEEEPSNPLIDFHRAYRAIAAARIEAHRPTQSDEVRQRCLQFVDYARERTNAISKPRLIATIGLIGAGKSTLANALAGEFGLRRISSEEIRDELFPKDDNRKSPVKRLDLDQANLVYQRLVEKARQSLQQGVSVVLDAGFFRTEFRQKALAVARECDAIPLFLHCRLAKTEAITRLDQRYRKNRTKLMPRPELYEEQVALFEDIDDLPTDSVLALNMSQPVPKLVESVRESL